MQAPLDSAFLSKGLINAAEGRPERTISGADERCSYPLVACPSTCDRRAVKIASNAVATSDANSNETISADHPDPICGANACGSIPPIKEPMIAIVTLLKRGR